MLIALYASNKDPHPRSEEVTFEELAARLSAVKTHTCEWAAADAPRSGLKDCLHKHGAAWSAVALKPCSPECSKKGSRTDCGGQSPHRLEANVVAITAAVFDLDHADLAAVKALGARLEASPLAFVVHSSHSHAPPSDCCVRVVFPLSRPFDRLPGEPLDAFKRRWVGFRNGLAARFGFTPDPQTIDLSRLYFLPTAPAAGPKPFYAYRDGQPVDVDEVLAQPAPVEAKTQAPSALHVVPEQSSGTAEPLDTDVVRKRIRALRKPESKALMVAHVLDGQALPTNEHDTATRNLAGVIAGGFPDVPDAYWEAALTPCFAASTDCGKGLDHHLAEFRQKLERAREFYAERRAQEKAEADELAELLHDESVIATFDSLAPVVELRPDAKPPGKEYAQEELEVFAEEQRCTLKGLRRRWVIQKAGLFFLFENGRYRLYLSNEVQNTMERNFTRAPIDIHVLEKQGLRLMNLNELVQSYGNVAEKIVSSLAIPYSYYDAKSRTFFEAVTPVRQIVPKEYPEIQRWLELLGGDQADKLLDWVATATRLDRQSCALYLHGKKGVGKTLLPNGLARLWTTGGPSPLARALSEFNSVIADCPLIFADESLPVRKNITAELRELIGTPGRSFERKYEPARNLEGAVRLIIAANNPDLLRTNADLTEDDLEAVAERILYIHCDGAAAAYLLELGGPPVVGGWILEDKIAAHALWLRDTRKVAEEKRFLVSGVRQRFHEALAVGSGITGEVCQWLVRALMTDKPGVAEASQVLVGEGEVWVNAPVIGNAKTWTDRVPSADVPSLPRIKRALTTLAAGRDVRVRTEHGQRRYTRVKGNTLLNWAEEQQLGDTDMIRAKIEAANPVIAEAKLRIEEGTP